MESWDSLRVFLALSRTGSLTKTAAQLGLSQPTVSRIVRGLERDLGLSLVLRHGTGMTLTQEGRDLATRAMGMEQAAEAVARPLARSVRIAAGGWMSRFLATHAGDLGKSDMPLEILNDYLDSDVSRGEVDIALRNRLPERGFLTVRRLPEPAYAVYGLAAGWSEEPNSWAEQDWVAFTEAQAHLPSAQWLRAAAPEARVRLRCNQAINILDGVRAGLGLGVLPRFVGDGDPTLRRLSPSLPLNGEGLWLVVHEDRRHALPVAATLERIIALFSGERTRLIPE